MSLRLSLSSIIISLLFSLALIGCGGSTQNTAVSTGQLSLNLTDAPGDYKAVYVTIKEVQVHDNNESWRLVSSVNKTFDLLTLRNGIRESLGLSDLAVGTYTQIRLLLSSAADTQENILNQAHPYANYVIFNDNTIQELKVPSGLQSGIKLVGNFTINANAITTLTLDFDADRSVVEAGSSGQWLLKPVIKTIAEEEYENHVFLNGRIQDNSGAPLEGVKVSLQKFSDSTIDLEAAAYSDINGSYILQSKALDYTLVAYKEGYLPYAQDVNLSSESNATIDITLATALKTGTVSISTDFKTGDEAAELSIRQNLSGLVYEVIRINIASGYTNTLTLPEGNYTAQAHYDDHISTQDINITDGGNVDWTISF